MTLRPTTY
jgi:hypothetical protein